MLKRSVVQFTQPIERLSHRRVLRTRWVEPIAVDANRDRSMVGSWTTRKAFGRAETLDFDFSRTWFLLPSSRKVFTGPRLDRGSAILAQLCVAWDCALVEGSGETDPVHALLDMPPKVRPSDLIHRLKTVSSRRLRSEFPALRVAYRGKPGSLGS
jgi:hypothetical protein